MTFLDQRVIGLIAVLGLAISTPVAAQEQSTVVQKDLSSFDKQQINCLAENIYFEAGNQSEAGKIAVSHVVMNRVESKKFPATPCKVIKQKVGKVCQFSWVCKRMRVRNFKLFSESTRIAEKVYFSSVKDNTSGSTFFHATYSRPSWAKIFRRTVRIGDHIFYRK